MADPIWGMLAKSQTNNETIEQAIARLILAHEQDEESHLGAGESLQSHKAAEVIDHLIRSVVPDKILESQKFTLSFPSIDAFDISIAGNGYITPTGLNIYLAAGDVVGNITSLSKSDVWGISLLWAKNPKIIFTARFGDTDLMDSYITFGAYLPFSTSTYNYFGVKTKYTNPTKIYACYRKSGGGETEVELPGINPTATHTFRIDLSNNGATLKYYVDLVLVLTINSIDIGTGSDSVFSFDIKNQAAGENPALAVWGFSIEMDY